jgi:ectoine hydroxylase-related dioxygenase (phytanoyl-CoA dioxygenase family)
MVSYKPTEADVKSYWEQGYWISPKLIDDARIGRLREALDRLFKGDFDGQGGLFDGQLNVPDDPLAMRRVINSWWVNDEIRDLVLDPGIGHIAGAFMKTPRVRLWADQAIVKPGTRGKGATKSGNIGWHQDAAYWHINSAADNMCTAWVALQDTDLAIGGMRTLVKSHRWGLVKESDKFYDPNLSTQREYFEKQGLGPWIDEPCILPAGHASFHHSLCFHGSEQNQTDKPRMSIIGHYMPDGASFAPSGRFQILLRLLGPRPMPGTKLSEPYWPMVYAAS